MCCLISVLDVCEGENTNMSVKHTCVAVSDLRVMVFGSSGHQQFSLTESIVQKRVFDGADPNNIPTTKTSGNVFERNVTLVNTPNLLHHDLLHYTSKKELKKAVCFSCPGPHAVVLTLNPSDLPPNPGEIFDPLMQYFGGSIFNHALIVLFHDEERRGETLKEVAKKNKRYRELLEKCGQRCLVFGGVENRSEGTGTRKLLEEIDEMVDKHGIFINLEFRDADKRITREEKILESQRKKEVSAMLEELKKKHSGEDLEREVNDYKERIRLENRERAEVRVADRLGFMLRVVDYAAAIGKGAFAGGVLAVAMGFPGIAVGAAVGAAFGGLIGGAAGAAWNFLSNVLYRT